MRVLTIQILIFSLLGCTAVKNPTSNQVEGTWEHTNYMYVRLQLDATGNGFAVATSNDGDHAIFKVDSFVSHKSWFTVNVKALTEPDDEKSTYKGVLYQDGPLCFSEVDGGDEVDETICFIKADHVIQSRENAIDVLQNLTGDTSDVEDM